MLYRCLVTLLLTGTSANAEVCDRDVYQLAESKEADDPVQADRINFTYESGIIVYEDGARETVYCIRNDTSAPVFVKWHGPKPGLLFESYATGYGLKTDKGQKTYDSTTKEDRILEYGLTRNYGAEVGDETYTFAQAERATLHQTQLTPLEVLGITLPDALADPNALDAYLAAYQSAPEGGNQISIYSYSRNWLPADVEVLAQISTGKDIRDFDGPFFQVSYGVRSVINIETKVATSSVRFWFGHFEPNQQALAQAIQSDVRSRLSLVTGAGVFTGLTELTAEEALPLSEAGGFFGQEIMEAKVGEGTAAQIVPWTVGLAFDGTPITAIQGEVIAN